ncbi:MAG: hypothetical protein AB7E52_03860, partial [Bdellovibrionales bacterium]
MYDQEKTVETVSTKANTYFNALKDHHVNEGTIRAALFEEMSWKEKPLYSFCRLLADYFPLCRDQAQKMEAQVTDMAAIRDPLNRGNGYLILHRPDLVGAKYLTTMTLQMLSKPPCYTTDEEFSFLYALTHIDEISLRPQLFLKSAFYTNGDYHKALKSSLESTLWGYQDPDIQGRYRNYVPDLMIATMLDNDGFREFLVKEGFDPSQTVRGHMLHFRDINSPESVSFPHLQSLHALLKVSPKMTFDAEMQDAMLSVLDSTSDHQPLFIPEMLKDFL